MKRAAYIAIAVLVLAAGLPGQEPGTRVPSVTFAPAGRVQIKPGGSASVQLDFRVGSEFHVNSNQPKSELLIPTALKFSSEGSVRVTNLKYPAGQEVSFPFAPGEKLSVYSGDFAIMAVIKASGKATAGEYPVRGELRFQACDRSACYPPRSIPVRIEVAVVGR